MNKGSQEIATANTKTFYKRKKLSATKRITYLATLVAASLVFKLLGNMLNFGNTKISIVYIPWLLSGIIMGPLGGATVVFATDIIGQLIISTGGAPLPLIVISNALFGFLAGLIFKIPKLDNRLKLLIATIAVTCVCTLGLTTYALAEVYCVPFKVEFVLRLPQALMVCVNAAVVAFLFPLLGKMGLVGGVAVPKKKEADKEIEQSE
ncbi:MAG: folate family ECF transporter S component [Clostridiales bacterium]|nr:folate family ECF transporter S component [Clostridiales bacterium]